MRYLILIMLFFSGCDAIKDFYSETKEDLNLDLVPEGATRNLWASIDKLTKAKNRRAGLLLDMARERYYTDKNTMDKVLQINKKTVACTDALPLSDKATMDAFISDMHRTDRIKPDSYYIQRFADFYASASACYEQHNTALNALLSAE